MQNHKKVIPFVNGKSPEHQFWRFYDWVLGDFNPIQDWYEALSDSAQEMFFALLKNNRKIENFVEWGGFKRFMNGDLRKEKVWELQFHSDKRAYRVLMVTGGERKQAHILMGCYHKQGVYVPAEALDTAYKRAKALKIGRAQSRERNVRE